MEGEPHVREEYDNPRTGAVSSSACSVPEREREREKERERKRAHY
jgi:hypothetical protein